MSRPKLIWDEFSVFAGRTDDHKFTLFKTDERAMAIDSGDVVRFKLAKKPGDDPLLDIDSLAASAAGSKVTKSVLGVENTTPAVVIVRFGQGDTVGLTPGDYFGELGLVDVSETNPANAFKRIAYGKVTLKPSPGGDVGPT
jgi:hypothetical protein